MPKYNTDKPVHIEEEDFFKRYGFAKRIADSIKSHKSPDCVVFGISGAWGEGKTSVLNFIETELSSSHPNIICLRFNPWRYSDENTLLASLFISLAQKIKETITDKKEKKELFGSERFVQNDDDPLKTDGENVGDLLNQYGKAAASLVGMGGAVGALGEGLSSIDIEKRKERIEKILEKTERRLIIFIDDIDRLDKDEIYSILKIVKLTGDFKYMTYILSFDDNMVASAIGERFGEGDTKAGRNFLEKIIQVPLQIPKAQDTLLKKFCFKIIDSALKESGMVLSIEEGQRFFNEFSSHVLSRLKTPRLAVRYGNSLQFLLPIMKGEVNVVDFMLIEAIKIFFPEFYEFIKNNSGYFIYAYIDVQDGEKINRIKSLVNELSKDYSDADRAGIQSLLQNIFPQLNDVYRSRPSHMYIDDSGLDDWYNEKRICSPKYFDRYFTYSIQEGEISDVEFEKILSELDTSNVQDLNKKFEDVINSASASDFLTKIRSREKTYSWEEAQKISKAIVLIGDKFLKDDHNTFFGYYSPLLEAAMFVSKLIDKGGNNKLKVSLAKELMQSTKSFEFAYQIHSWLVSNNDKDKIFSIDECDELSRGLIHKAVEDSKESSIFEIFDFIKMRYLFFYWSNIDEDGLKSYIKTVLNKDKSKAITLIESFTPTGRSSAHPEPYKGDFDKEQYDWMAQIFDIDYIYEVLQEAVGYEIDISDVIFAPYRGIPNPNSENILKQFVHWHKKAIKEDESGKVAESIEKTN